MAYKGVDVRRFIPSPAMCVALLALAVALSGTAVAATGLINGGLIRPHTVAMNALTKAAIAGLRGQTGAAGKNGTFDPEKLIVVQGNAVTVAPGGQAFSWAACPAGSYQVGGGGFVSIGRMMLSGPTENGQQGWTISVLNDTTTTISGVVAYAECAAP